MTDKPLSVEANRHYHEHGVVDLTKSTVERASSAAFRRKIGEDFVRAKDICAAGDDRPLVSLDCLTGDGEWIAQHLAAGFARVVAVDLSPDEIEKIKGRDYGGEVIPVVAEICSYFDENTDAFDFIYFNSLHHIEDYLPALKRAVGSLRQGGVLYMAETEQPKRLYGKMLLKLDDHLFALMADPRKWLARVSTRLGLNFDRDSKRAWTLARQSEVHAATGLDFRAIRKTTEDAGCRVCFEDHRLYPQSRLVARFKRWLSFPSTAHLCVQRIA